MLELMYMLMVVAYSFVLCLGAIGIAALFLIGGEWYARYVIGAKEAKHD